ncbi:MAG: Holliday junction resolvase Hjc [Euryarchaeota archaeon]
MSYRKGADFERRLVEYVRRHGGEAVRVAGSGGPVDVVAYAPARGHLAIECKVRREDRLYVRREEVEGLIAFAERFRAEPLLAWNPAHRRTGFALNAILLRPEDLERRERSYSVDYETALRVGLDPRRLFTRSLEEW